MITHKAFTRLPECFQNVILQDRLIRSLDAVPIHVIRSLRANRRLCHIYIESRRDRG